MTIQEHTAIFRTFGVSEAKGNTESSTRVQTGLTSFYKQNPCEKELEVSLGGSDKSNAV